MLRKMTEKWKKVVSYLKVVSNPFGQCNFSGSMSNCSGSRIASKSNSVFENRMYVRLAIANSSAVQHRRIHREAKTLAKHSSGDCRPENLSNSASSTSILYELAYVSLIRRIA